MENAIRLFLADPSRDYLELLCRTLSQQEDLIIAGTALTGDRALETFPDSNADLLVTELLLPKLEGISLLRRLREKGCLRHAIVVSSFHNEHTAEMASGLADYYLTKPCRMEDLIGHIREAARGPSRRGAGNPSVTQLLLDFGIPPHLDGFAYLRESIQHIQADRTLLRGVTKVLYRDIAKRYGTTSKCVERSTRSAIKTGWDRSSRAQRSMRFGTLFDSYEKAPSNVPFLTAMIEFIEAQNEQAQRLRR